MQKNKCQESLRDEVIDNLGNIVDEIKDNQWKINYHKDTDEFYWSNKNASPSEESIIVAIDDYISISIDAKSGKIEYLYIEYFNSCFIEENPEYKKFASYIVRDRKDRKNLLCLMRNLIGAIVTSDNRNEFDTVSSKVCA